MTEPTTLEARALHALSLHQQGATAEARAIYREVLALVPDNADLLFLSGLAALQMADYADAAATLARATNANPGHADAWFNHGLALLYLGQYQAAIASFDRTATLDPSRADTFINRAVALLNLERAADALSDCARAIALKPDHADAHHKCGITLRQLKRYDAALTSFGQAIALNPADAEAYSNRGLTYADLRQHQTAVGDYDHAISLRPDYADAYLNRGVSLGELGDSDAALADYKNALARNPSLALAHVNAGHLYRDAQQLEKAIAHYKAARRLKADFPFLQGQLLYAQAMNCDWDRFDDDVVDLHQRIARGERAASAFPALVLTDDPALQRQAISTWRQVQYPTSPQVPAPPVMQHSAKIRLGYFSMDFRDHPIATLTAGLYEAHDRTRFEVHGFSYGPETKDTVRARLEKGFDTFIDVRAKSDAEIVALAREMGIDIAIDLAGYTKDARPEIFMRRAAPLQVSYLGFPGTLAMPTMDYIIADAVVIPPEARAHYGEKIAYLPAFQANDDKRRRPDTVFSRAELGLPDTGFVFCCFNNVYKITPQVFATWMGILRRVPDSVLFLYAGIESAAENLRRAAAAHGIAPERLIFGKRLAMDGYLARYKTADLALDTLPYNAGTTAADALWMDLPVLTCAGRSYASRMAAGLLHALDLPELVTQTLEDYENRAVALATRPDQLAVLKEKLVRNRATWPSFNTTVFTRALEDAYTQMAERARAGLPPDHIFVK